MNRNTGAALITITLLLGCYVIGAMAAHAEALGGYIDQGIPLFSFTWIAPLIFSLLLIVYLIAAETMLKPGFRHKTTTRILLSSVLFLPYALYLIYSHPYMHRTIGWTGRSEMHIEPNPLIATSSIFAVVLLLSAARFHYRTPALLWLAVLIYAWVPLYLIIIWTVMQAAPVPQQFMG